VAFDLGSGLFKYRYFLVLLLTLFLVGCDTNVECIEADEWGEQVTFTIGANNNSQYSQQSNNLDIGNWISTGYIVDANVPMVAVVNNNVALAGSQQCGVVTPSCTSSGGQYCSTNTWSAWYGDQSNTDPSSNGWQLANNALCTFPCGGQYPWCPSTSYPSCNYDGYDVPVSSIPCLFYGGLGLLGVVSDSYNSIPNATDPFLGSQNCNPQSNLKECFVHVGDNATAQPFYDNYCPASGFILNPPSTCQSCGLNFKIDDRYYNDNVGQYTLTFKQGLVSDNCGPLANFTQYIAKIICNSAKQVYNQIVDNPSFLSYIRVFLILYIVYLGLAFVMGFSEMTHKEFVIAILKFGLITQLSTSATSWNFFDNYFFNFFVQGVGDLTGILFGVSQNTCPLSGDCAINVSGIQAFDSAISQLFSYDTTRKIMTLLTWQVYGFFYVGIIYIAIIIILYAIVRSVVLFLVSFLAMSILIALAPIFLPFILFRLTHSFFERWLGQLVSYFIQPLVVLTFAFFMVTMLINQLQFIFGYRVCWKEWFNIPVVNIEFYSWQPDYDGSSTCMLTPNAIYSETIDGMLELETYPGNNYCSQTGGATPPSNPNQTCDAYMCYQNRYIGYPYLDPNLGIDSNRIQELQNGNLLSFGDLVIFMLMIWFMFEFNKLVPDLAKRLGGAGVSTDINRAASSIGSGVANFAGNASYQALNPAYKWATGGRDLKKDVKSIRKAVLFEKSTPNEIKLEEKRQEYNKLYADINKDINNTNIPLEAKQSKIKQLNALKNEIADISADIVSDKKKAGTAQDPNRNNANVGNVFERSAKIGSGITNQYLSKTANAPISLLSKGLGKVAKYTVGAPLQVGKKIGGLAVKGGVKLAKSGKNLANKAVRAKTTDNSQNNNDNPPNNEQDNDRNPPQENNEEN